MNIFIFIGALLPLMRAASATETEFYAYTMVKSEISQKIQNVSTYLYNLEGKVQNISKEFHWNVSCVRQTHGWERYSEFKEKYATKVNEFARNLNTPEQCSQYVRRLLQTNRTYWSEISRCLETAVATWRVGLSSFYKKVADLRVRLGAIDMESYNCAALYSNDIKAPFNCAIKVLDTGKRIDSDAVVGVGLTEFPQFLETQASALTKLHETIKTKSVQSLYEENEHDDYLKKNCIV
ncbi:uncharacterized protein LOC135161242 [Diachasmimorpha longicaudata]|uniref:uncharacterized protein LOC135161242 n=1 Tax=Diachasmimorpha longicaudata TaxID=58733 RepID=UPI0030B8D7BE